MMRNECKIDLCTLTKADLKLKKQVEAVVRSLYSNCPVRASLMQQYALMNPV